MQERYYQRQFSHVLHYTTQAGLYGILDSQSLWATNYKFLNDPSEIKHGISVLSHLVKPIFRQLIDKQNVGGGISMSFNINKYNSDLYYDLAFSFITDFIENIYDNEIYLTSFSSQSDNDNHVYDDGLLSQWRSYAQGSGYAIEFDDTLLSYYTKNIKGIYGCSGIKCVYACANLQNREHVKKLDKSIFRKNERMSEKFEVFSNALKNIQYRHIEIYEKNGTKGFRASLDFIDIESTLGDIMESLMFLVCGIKNLHYSEEKEYRLVILRDLKERYPMVKKKILSKQVSYFKRNDKDNPYISLFEKTDKLPIKRIIVGPHPEQEDRESALKNFLDTNFKDHDILVHGSTIPYLHT